LLLLAAAVLGCRSEPPKAVTPKVSVTHSTAADWIPFDLKGYGVSLRLPPGWKVESQANGGVPVKPDAGTKAEVDQHFGQVQVIFSALSGAKASAMTFPDTLSVVYVAQKEPHPIDDKYASDTLAELKQNFPRGEPRVELNKIPAGQALHAVYKDVGTLGLSDKTKDAKTIPVTVVQVHVERGNVLYVFDLTGSADDEAQLIELADRIALTIKLT